jgi:Fic family protein
VIENAPLIPSWEAKFRKDAEVRIVHHGTHLEGNELTKEQTEKVISVQETGLAADHDDAESTAKRAGVLAQMQDVQEVINYRIVLDWIDTQITQAKKSKDEVIYSETVLKAIHALVVEKVLDQQDAGTYRTKQVVIRSVDTGDVAYRPPVSFEIPELLQSFFSWLNSGEARSLHPVLRAGILHYELVRIHPFLEGNGRTARAFMLYLLHAEGYAMNRLFSLEEYFDKDVEGYYRAILSVQQHPENDMTYWLEYFCFGLAVELDHVKEQIVKLSKDARLRERLGGKQVALTERQILLLEAIQRGGQITTYEANDILPMVSQDTILRDLRDLIIKGVIRKEGVTKGVVYILNE